MVFYTKEEQRWSCGASEAKEIYQGIRKKGDVYGKVFENQESLASLSFMSRQFGRVIILG